MNQKLKPLLEDTDARRWADEIIMAYNSDPLIRPDYDFFVTWFANAIMCGYDAAMRREGLHRIPTKDQREGAEGSK